MVVEDDDQVCIQPQPQSYEHTDIRRCLCIGCKQCLFCLIFRPGSRSIPSCSSWPAPRAASTCGSALWRATPSSGSDSQPRAKPATATSHGSALASDSGKKKKTLQSDSTRSWPSTWYQHMETTCHKRQSLCIYGYSVSMVTWICSYGDWDMTFVLFVFFRLLSVVAEAEAHTWGHFLSFAGASKQSSVKSILH